MKKFTPLALLPLLLAASACDDTALHLSCPDAAAPAVVVIPMDASTGLEVGDLAAGSWTTGNLSDSLRHVGIPRTQLAAYGPPGVYTLRVTRPGYVTWFRANVVVADDACGPATTHVHASMAPLSQGQNRMN